MEETRKIHVATGVAYDVFVRAGVVAETAKFVKENFPKAAKVAVVVDSNVDRLHGDRVVRLLEDGGLRVERIVFPAGEQSKTLETYAELVRSLAALRFSRKDLVVALGGGVTGDMAGFAAATYMRKIDFVQVPTSLLAMVDSSVGGKTAVDIPEGTNLVGAFHQPRAVFCDPDFLGTLPESWRLDGMGEVVKYAILGDADLFARLEARPLEPIATDDIARCIEMKRDVVSRDEFETGERKTLNLGHTFAHAIEKLSGYTTTHGCAVATGLAMAARAAVKLGVLATAEGARIAALVDAMGYETRSRYAPADLAQAMGGDKKAAGGSVDLVLPVAVGKCIIRPTPLADLTELCK